MPHVTDLVYLEADTARPIAARPDAPAIDWAPFGPDTEADFRAVLQATYIESLDMPELEGLRSLDDILTSHRAGGRFVAERWRVGHVRGEPEAAAVLLLSETPDARRLGGRLPGPDPRRPGAAGWAASVLAHAVDLARPHTPRLELAVDVRNHPAHHLYRNAGLRPFDRRAVHLASFRGEVDAGRA